MSDRYAALIALLAQPDPPYLPQRAHRLTREGRHDRRSVLAVPLAMKAVQHQLHDREDCSSARLIRSSRLSVVSMGRHA